MHGKGIERSIYARMKKLSFTQGKLLIKLVDRQSNQTSYELVKAFMDLSKQDSIRHFAVFVQCQPQKEYDPRVGGQTNRTCGVDGRERANLIQYLPVNTGVNFTDAPFAHSYTSSDYQSNQILFYQTHLIKAIFVDRPKTLQVVALYTFRDSQVPDSAPSVLQKFLSALSGRNFIRFNVRETFYKQKSFIIMSHPTSISS